MPVNRYPIDEIRAKVSLAEVIGTYVRLKKAGKNLVGLCPFHNEKTPSFNVSEEHGRWKCYGCGASGDVFEFLMRMEGLTFPDAVEQLARKAGVNIERVTASGTRDRKQRLLQAVLAASFFFRNNLAKSQKALDYLNKRGLPEDAREKYGIGYAPSEWSALLDHLKSKGFSPNEAHLAGLVVRREQSDGYYDRFRDRLMFPIFDLQDRVIGFGGRAFGDEKPKYLNSPEGALFAKNRVIYGLNFARKAIAENDRVIIVEGYFDAITAQLAGFGNAVATMGTALTAEHVSILSRYTKNAVIAFDSDSAGISAAMRSAAMFEEADFAVYVAELPAGEDPDSLLQKGQTNVFAKAISEAVSLPQFRINKVIAAHDGKTEQGRARILRECAAVISEVASSVERERLMDLILVYHPSFEIDNIRAKESLRADIDRIISRRKPNPPVTYGNVPIQVEKPVKAGISTAEEYLIKAMLENRIYCDLISSKISGDDFINEPAKNLAKALLEGFSNIDEVANKIAGTDAESILNDLLVSQGEPKPTEQGVLDAIQRLMIYHKRQKEKRLRTLTKKIEAGELTRNDPEFEEFWSLVRELHK